MVRRGWNDSDTDNGEKTMSSEVRGGGRSSNSRGRAGGRGRAIGGRGRGRGRGRGGRGRSQRGGRSIGPRNAGRDTTIHDDEHEDDDDEFEDIENEMDLKTLELAESLEKSEDPQQSGTQTTSNDVLPPTSSLPPRQHVRRGGREGRGFRNGRSADVTTTRAGRSQNESIRSSGRGGRSESGRSSSFGGRSQRGRGRSSSSSVASVSTAATASVTTAASTAASGQKGERTKEVEFESDTNPKSVKPSTVSAKLQSGNKDTSSTDAPLAPSIPPNQPQQTSDINYGKGERITVLHVAEKPSIAQAIAHGLAGKGATKSQGRALPVHEFDDPAFPKAPKVAKCTHRVTSVAGHVFAVDFPSQYQSWDSVDPAELFDAPIQKKAQKGSVVKHLQDCARGVHFIVLWMDCDREGENINFEVLECCLHLMHGGPQSSPYDRVYRAYFSAINPSDIQKAYNALGKPDQNQAWSVDARQELDLKIGVAFSRFQTRFFQGRYGDLDSAVLSYGPCQTPTLGFCVQRQIDIEMFKPEPYWVLELSIAKRGRMLRALWDSGRSFNKGRVEALIIKAMEESSIIRVTDVVTKDKKQGRPIPLNTVALLKACSKALGIGPHSTMQAAERLYLSGYLSYPRTESTAYPKSFDIPATLQQQASDGRWGAYVRELLRTGATKSRGGVDMGDHPPITPCRAAGPSELIGDMARIYDLVVRHFIASVSQDALWRSTKVEFSIESLADKGTFSVRGKQMVTPGFLAILMHKEYGDKDDSDPHGDEEEEEETLIPEFAKGEEIPLLKSATSSGSSKVSVATGASCWGVLDIKEKMTTPPTYLTESELIGLMEKNGIGTDASIPTHIENIMKRNYASLETGRRICPTKLGLVLVQGYHQIDSGLVLPKVRSDIEDQCNKIAKGLARRDEVVRRAIDIFRSKFDFFVKHIDRMDVLFGSSFAKLEDVGKPFTRCGLTMRYLQYIPGPPPRLYNRFTETVYPLPSGGVVKQWTGRKCPVEGCGFELCLYLVGQPPRTFPLCPNCFNSADWALAGDDPAEDPVDRDDANKERTIRRMAGKSLILECPLPDEHPLIEEMIVGLDPDDDDAVLILDPHLGPKWRLVSTRNPTIIHLPQTIEKVTVLGQKDDVHDVHLMKVEYKAGQSPLEGGETRQTICYPSDETFQKTVRVFHGSDRMKGTARGGRGRGRGRGRGGRGGRDGRRQPRRVFD